MNIIDWDHVEWAASVEKTRDIQPCDFEDYKRMACVAMSLRAEITQLRAELEADRDQALARLAVAYEAAADAAFKAPAPEIEPEAEWLMEHQRENSYNSIRSLTPADAKAALQRVVDAAVKAECNQALIREGILSKRIDDLIERAEKAEVEAERHLAKLTTMIEAMALLQCWFEDNLSDEVWETVPIELWNNITQVILSFRLNTDVHVVL